MPTQLALQLQQQIRAGTIPAPPSGSPQAIALTAALGSSVDNLRNPNHMCDCRKEMDEREHIDILTYDKISEGVL